MLMPIVRHNSAFLAAKLRLVSVISCAALTLAYSSSAQQPSAQPDATQQTTAPAVQTPATPATPATSQVPQEAGGISEADLKQILVGKALFLRDGYLDNSLSFNEYGHLIGHSPQGSYTLNAIQIDRVRLSKHKVTLEGARYGLHFLGQLAFEDTSSAYDRVRITPNKKVLKITIDREVVVKPKKEAKGGKEPTAGKEESDKVKKAIVY